MSKDRILLILLGDKSNVPIYRQIYELIRQIILDGKLQPKTHFPVIRLLAKQLSIASITMINAYEQLFAEVCLKEN